MKFDEIYDDTELERVIQLAELDLDYQRLQKEFKHLTRLAAGIAKTEISLINIIDTYTQWSVSSYNLDLGEMPREESVCQVTIMEDEYLEVERLDRDERFREKEYVTGEESLRYYFGLPIKLASGAAVGALCVMSRDERSMTAEQIAQLKLIALEVEKRLDLQLALSRTEKKAGNELEMKKRLAHDIRGAISGIVGLSEISSLEDASADEMRQYLKMIKDSGNNILELTEEILQETTKDVLPQNVFTLRGYAQKLESMYAPQAKYKKINLEVVYDEHDDVKFSRKHLLPVAGNLISNAIKFTSPGGRVRVLLKLKGDDFRQRLRIEVQDNGTGMREQKLKEVTKGVAVSQMGTLGEKGFGFGLRVIGELVDALEGNINVSSTFGEGTRVAVEIPMASLKEVL